MTDSIFSINKIVKSILWYVAAFAFVLCVWQIAAVKVNSPLVLPFPEDVLISLKSFLHQEKFRSAFFNTFSNCLYAFVVSCVAGIVIGFLCSLHNYIHSFLNPIIIIVQSIPVIAVIMLCLFWLSSEEVPVMVCELMTCPVITLNAYEGFKKTDTNLVKIAYTYNLSFWQKFIYIRLFIAMPFIKASMKTCMGLTWKVIAAGEVLSLPKNTLGNILSRSNSMLETQEVYAVTVVIVLASIFSNIMLQVIMNFAGRISGLLVTHTNVRMLKKNLSGTVSESKDIEVNHLTFLRDTAVFEDLSVKFPAGKISLLLGQSGCGKTTLLDYIAFSNKQTNGSQNFRVSYMFQNSCLFEQLTVLQNVKLPLINLMSDKEATERSLVYIKQAGLEHKINERSCNLSGGEKQRVSLARSFAYLSDVLLLDEAFSSQDIATKLTIVSLLKRLQKTEERTVIMVSHDLSDIKEIADKVFVLSGKPARLVYEREVVSDAAGEIIEQVKDCLFDSSRR